MNQFDNEVSSTLKEIAERVETPPYLKDRIDKELLRRCPEYRKKIAVIFGGCSPEYSVSLQSAYAVISHMDTEVYTPVLIGISQSGDWFLYEGDIEKIVSDTWCGGKDCTPVVVSPNRTSHNLLLLENGKVKKLHIDAAFPVLHGRNGEDGTIQGLFEMAGIPVVGCGVLSSALCMDKDRAHKLVHTAGIAVPSSFVLGKSASVATALQQAEKIGYPWSKDKVALVCNDSGKVDGLPLNRCIEDYDVIAGNFFICGFSGEEFCSLTDKQFRYYKKLFRDPELFLPTPIGIMPMKCTPDQYRRLMQERSAANRGER